MLISAIVFVEFLDHDWFKVVESANRQHVCSQVTGLHGFFFLPITANIRGACGLGFAIFFSLSKLLLLGLYFKGEWD